jgi:hypothetical protein
MEGRQKPSTDKYNKIMNNWKYDASSVLTSHSVSDLENFRFLIFVA